MPLNDYRAEHPPHPNPYSATDIITLLHENHWLATTPTPEHLTWAERAAQLLGHYAEDRAALANLLRPVFHYDASRILQSPGPKPPSRVTPPATSSAISPCCSSNPLLSPPSASRKSPHT